MKIFYKYFSVMLLTLIIPLFTQASSEFPDVPNSHRNADAIQYVKDVNIVDGYPDGNFKPYKSINRAEYTKILVEAQFSNEIIDSCIKAGDSPYFSDVENGVWFEKYICVALENGLIGGYPDGTFRPAETINFVESAKILVNAFVEGDVANTDDEEWFAKYVIELADDKRAVPGTILNFAKEMERGEVAEMIYRVKEEVTDKESPTFSDLQCPNGDIVIEDNATIDGICVKTGNVIIGNNVDVVNDIVVLNGNITIKTNVNIGGNIRTIEEGSLYIGNNADIEGNIQIERGNLILASNPNIGGDVKVFQGNIDLRSNLDVTGKIIALRGSVKLAENATVGDIEAYGDVVLEKNGDAISILSENGNVDLGDNVTVEGDITATNGTLTIGLNVDIEGSIDAKEQIGNSEDEDYDTDIDKEDYDVDFDDDDF